jgi:Glycosyl hydrolases family 28
MRRRRIVFTVFWSTLLAPACRAAETLPPLFSVELNGQNIPLHDFPQGSLAIFPVHDTVKVHIRTDFEAFHTDVRPASAGATPIADLDKHGVTFTLTTTTPITVEFNKYTDHVLHLFPEVKSEHPISGPAPGVIYFGPGEHQAGVIEVHTGESVYLAEGAWVHGRIRSRNTHGISIAGPGVLDGTGVAVPDTELGPEGMVFLDHAADAHIEGSTIFNSIAWTVHIQGSSGARVNGVRILNPENRNGNDGFNVDSSSDVDIRNVFVRTGDDCVAIKNMLNVPIENVHVSNAVLWNMPNGGNALEIGYELRDQPVRHISFDQIDMIHVEHGAALGIHDGDASTVEDVKFSNIRIEDVRRKLIDFEIFYTAWSKDHPMVAWPEMVVRMDRGGARDGRIMESPEEVRQHAPDRGTIRDITVDRVEITEGGVPYSVLSGFDATHRITGVHIGLVVYHGHPITNAADLRLFEENADQPIIELYGRRRH